MSASTGDIRFTQPEGKPEYYTGDEWVSEREWRDFLAGPEPEVPCPPRAGRENTYLQYPGGEMVLEQKAPTKAIFRGALLCEISDDPSETIQVRCLPQTGLDKRQEAALAFALLSDLAFECKQDSEIVSVLRWLSELATRGILWDSPSHVPPF
jgi:hypothetical protein